MDAVFLLMTFVSCGPDALAYRAPLGEAKIGALPAGFVTAKTGEGQGSVWKIVQADDAPGGSKKALAQTASSPSQLFNLCVADKTSFKDLDLTVSFKSVAGKIDQGGGPVWRYQDADNYYIARMNPLEDNFRVYKIVGGKRMQLGSSDAEVEAGKWHTIRIVHKGKRIQCYLNGKLHLDVTDDAIAQAGKVGLWTKADAQTWFAELHVRKE